MPVVCGICKRAPRIGDDMKRIRLTEDDMTGMKFPDDKKPGLYSCCSECYDEYLPIIAARMDKDVGEMTYNDVV